MKTNSIYAYARQLRKNPTPAEAFFWSKVRRKAISGFRFQRQFIIEHEQVLGRSSYFIADFCCYAKSLIVELDGPIHANQLEYDEIRTEILEEMGYRVIRFSNEEVLHNWRRVQEIVRAALEI